MSKEHTAWALLCHHWKSEFVPKAATAQRTAGSVCMQARLIHRLRRREAVKSWLRFHLNLPFHSKGASSFLSVLLSSQHLFDYFTNLGWPNNLPFFLPSFLDYHLISLARKGNPYIHVLVGDSKEQNVKLMVEEVFLLPLRLMSLLAPDLFFIFFLHHNKQCVTLVWILSQCSGPFLRDVGWKCSISRDLAIQELFRKHWASWYITEHFNICRIFCKAFYFRKAFHLRRRVT